MAKKQKKKVKNLGAKIFIWILIIVMVASTLGSILSYLIF